MMDDFPPGGALTLICGFESMAGLLGSSALASAAWLSRAIVVSCMLNGASLSSGSALRRGAGAGSIFMSSSDLWTGTSRARPR